MKYLCLLIFILSIYPSHQSFHHRYQRKIPFFVKPTTLSHENYNTYRAIITGQKREVPKSLIKSMKRYGTIHLLTPSGIHLTSLLVLFKFYPQVLILVLILFFFLIQRYEGYHSLERVIIFKLTYQLMKEFKLHSLEMCFVITFLWSFIFGHYQQSSLSLIYSCSFWGTIIIYRKNPLKAILYLNFTLFFLGSLNYASHSVLSLLVNPLVTSLTSLCFPFLFLNALLPAQFQADTIINYIMDGFIWIHTSIYNIDIFPEIIFSPYLLLVFILLVQLKRVKLAIFLLCFFSWTPQPKIKTYQNKYYNRTHELESFESKKNQWFYGADKKCKQQEIRFYCKKKPSKLGGPVF